MIGVFGGYYNSAACLFVNSKLIAFIEEEKITRKKGEKDIYPIKSIKS